MTTIPPFENWPALRDAPHSAFFHGTVADVIWDRSRNAPLAPFEEALFTQSNGRILLGQGANGMLRFAALPTQVYPAPTAESEFGLGPGMYHHFDVAMYAGNLTYLIQWDGDANPLDLSGDGRDNMTVYADHFIPLTRSVLDGVEISLVSLAPLAADAEKAALAPAPLPGPAGAIYSLHLRNTSHQVRHGKVILQAGSLLVGHYEDADPAWAEMKRPTVDIRQQTLILSRPEGSVGIHLHNGVWTRLSAPFQAECTIELQPGAEKLIETHLALGQSYAEILPVIYELHLRPALDWLNLTAVYWRSRLGSLEVGSGELAQFSRDSYIRSLFDNFNCLQTDAQGSLIAHWQGAPSHGYGTVWGIDVEPTAVSIASFCPQMARQVMLFFLTRSHAPVGKPEHSVPILVAPMIIARQWLQTTGDYEFLRQHPEVMQGLKDILDELLALKAPGEMLFPSCFSSDGPVGRRYDYGTNVKVWYAFESLAYLLRQLELSQEARLYSGVAEQIRSTVYRTMVMDGPFGKQISGGTNLGEDPGTFYLPEGIPYYDGEDTSSMLAPIYGFCDFNDETWLNYHRFARSIWCPNFDPEFEALRWSPGEFGSGALDGTGFYSRLGGSLTPAEMREALENLRFTGTDDVTGSVFWWPHGLEYKRSLTRCSQGQGAWAWQYLQEWLGIAIDAPAHTLTLAPRGLIDHIEWRGFHSGAHCFDLSWQENGSNTAAEVTNHNTDPWTVKIGFRQWGAGAAGPLTWQTCAIASGEKATFTCHAGQAPTFVNMDRKAVVAKEAAAFGGNQGVIFKRYGPALLWGHWDSQHSWDVYAMPFSLRFLLVNGSQQDWTDVTVALITPAGWRAQARQPQHWIQPNAMSAGITTLQLGRLPSFSRKVAPFWIEGPRKFDLVYTAQSFHTVSQPGDSITLEEARLPNELTYEFKARLTATTARGEQVTQELSVPVRIVPK